MALLQVVTDYFLNRTDRLANLAPWGKPCPIESNGSLDEIINAHLGEGALTIPHREDIRVNVWELLWQHDEAQAREHWGKNEDSCFGFYRPCDYLPICSSLDSEIEIQNNFRLKLPHSEQVESDLPIVA